MRTEEKLPGTLQEAVNKGLLKRMPLTFQPYVNQQIHQWDYLFPNERRSVEQLILYVESLTSDQSAELFRNVVDLEDKMGVRRWQFSTNEQTIQNSSQLAASPYYQDWRRAVQAVFDAADQQALKTRGHEAGTDRRLILIGIPANLPVDGADVWRRWGGSGRIVKLDIAATGGTGSVFELLIAGSAGGRSTGLLNVALGRPAIAPANTWVVDAGRSLGDALMAQNASSASEPRAISLSFGRLGSYRQIFSHEMNTMRKDLADADAVFDHLRSIDVTSLCPVEVKADPAIREFVRSLYLTGNGAVIFGNSFVQWAASEAFRRARPSFLAAQFGVRSKPKPFTGVAVFDNPDQVNPLPAVDDLPGSAVDAQMLALYVWLAAARYPEYQRSTVCVCIAESLSEAYLVAPPEFAFGQAAEPVSVVRLEEALRSWLA